jgi:hypothetical protein
LAGGMRSPFAETVKPLNCWADGMETSKKFETMKILKEIIALIKKINSQILSFPTKKK